MLQRRPLFVSFVDLQKAYDMVQHGLLSARLEGIGVGPKMLAAIKSLYANGTGCGRVALSALLCFASSLMACIAIWIAVCRMRDCSWALADECLLACLPAILSCCLGRLLGCKGFWLACVRSAWASGRHYQPSKTEVIVFNGSSSDTWYVEQHVLPQTATFKCLGIVFHEFSSMVEAFARLPQNGKGAAACLAARL